jgi:predicted GNAT family N-acyltransferase
MLIKEPSECTKEELESFKNLVLYGGQVDPIGLEDRIKKCRFLAFCYSDNEELIGVSAVKQKNKNSVQNVMKKAGASDSEIPTIELGYSVTKAEYRSKGINRQLNDELLDKVKGEKIYATTDNDTMRKYLQEKGFNKKGKSFIGTFNENLDYFEK